MSSGLEPAGRGRRLAAFFVDMVAGGVPFWLAVNEPVGAALNLIGSLAFLLILAVQWCLLAALGQTLGKKAAGIRIVKVSTGANGGFTANVLLRTWLNALLSLLSVPVQSVPVPVYFLADSLLIFRDDRRCIHDFIAGTRVVRA